MLIALLVRIAMGNITVVALANTASTTILLLPTLPSGRTVVAMELLLLVVLIKITMWRILSRIIKLHQPLIVEEGIEMCAVIPLRILLVVVVVMVQTTNQALTILVLVAVLMSMTTLWSLQRMWKVYVPNLAVSALPVRITTDTYLHIVNYNVSKIRSNDDSLLVLVLVLLLLIVIAAEAIATMLAPTSMTIYTISWTRMMFYL
jgi:hypothetical protein